MTDDRKPRTLGEYLDDMKRSINRLIEISSAGEAAFMTREDKQDAAIRHIQILGGNFLRWCRRGNPVARRLTELKQMRKRSAVTGTVWAGKAA